MSAGFAFRRPRRRDGDSDDAERPEMAAVLDHYEIQYSPMRVSQMVHCPLHEEKTPSLSLHLGRGLWKCHSCGDGGDSYTLMMKLEGITFVRARALASSLGLTTADAGGRDRELSGSRYGGGREIPAHTRNRARRGGQVPAGRRR